MSEQQPLTEYCAGMFDGDGSINTNVAEVDYKDHNHRILAECTITNRYVAGLFDAEGCVKPTVAKKTNSAVNHHIDPQSRIANSNDPLAAKLSEFAEALDVPYSIYHHDGDGENRDPTFQFDIRSISGVQKFLSALKPHLVVKKPQAEIMLNEVLPRLDAREHSNKRGFLGVMYHIDRINELKGGNRGKYNLEYFEDLWGMEYEP